MNAERSLDDGLKESDVVAQPTSKQHSKNGSFLRDDRPSVEPNCPRLRLPGLSKNRILVGDCRCTPVERRAHMFKDRVIAITGAASGIGRALAVHLGQQGAALALSDIDEAGLSATAAELREGG